MNFNELISMETIRIAIDLEKLKSIY